MYNNSGENMKKMLGMLIVLFAIYFGIQIIFNVLGKGGEDTYILKNDYTFKVYEKATFKLKNRFDNYYFKVEVEDTTFTFQLFNGFSKHSRVIDDIKYFEVNNYKCILPIFETGIVMDALCKDGNVYIYANTLDNSSLNKKLNEVEGYKDKFNIKEDMLVLKDMRVNKNALVQDHYIGINTYRGLRGISKNYLSVYHDFDFFKKDVYNSKISTFNNQYYLVADYNSNYEFNTFYVVDLVKIHDSERKYHSTLSFDSYIQGVVDNKAYVYDKDSKKQYEIDLENDSFVEVGNASKGIKYYNQEWTIISVKDANEGKLFVTDTKETNPNYAKLDKYGEEVGFYYLFEKSGNKYKVYRKNIQDDNLTYLFTTDNLNTFYYDNYVYYIDNNKLKVYSELTGTNTVLEYNELTFNKNIAYNVYKRG